MFFHNESVFVNTLSVPVSDNWTAIPIKSASRLPETGSEAFRSRTDFTRSALQFRSNKVNSEELSVGDNKFILLRSESTKFGFEESELAASVFD